MTKRLDGLPDDSRWAVLEKAGHRWWCRCACGTEKWVDGYSVRKGTSRACGCYRREAAARVGRATRKHGAAAADQRQRDPLYRLWLQMRYRCNTPTSPDWKYYGDRGIRVAPCWDDFEQFRADVGKRPTRKHTLDRIDNDGDYEPGNVRWATRREQARNRRFPVSRGI